jgi:REP element-mobilizing transposase RayT
MVLFIGPKSQTLICSIIPRTARIASKEHVYHVLTGGNNRQNVFEDEENFRRYQDLLFSHKEKYQFKLYHYIMMTNHVHLVMEPLKEGGDDFVKGIATTYNMPEKIKCMGRQRGWRKDKENRPL